MVSQINCHRNRMGRKQLSVIDDPTESRAANNLSQGPCFASATPSSCFCPSHNCGSMLYVDMATSVSWSGILHHGEMVLSRFFITLILILSTSAGLPLLSIAWLQFGPSHPRIDDITESIVRYHNVLSSGALYAGLLCSIADLAFQASTGT